MAETQKEALRKSNEAIHIAGKLSLLDRKLFNVLLVFSFKHLTKKETYTVTRKELCGLAGFDSKDDTRIKASLRRLNTTQIEWDILAKKKSQSEWGISTLLSSVVFKGGKCEYSFSPHLREKLLNPKIYTLFHLAIQRRFNSGYTLALYENLKRYLNVRSSGWIEIKTFRKLIGADTEYYENFKMLNYRIIRPAVEEINKYSDIVVEPEYKREKRRITAIRFKIKKNKQPSLFKMEAELYKAEAQKCWKSTYGNCAATWDRYKDVTDHACHYCTKFSQQRLNP